MAAGKMRALALCSHILGCCTLPTDEAIHLVRVT